MASNKFLSIPVEVYRLHVIVTWERNPAIIGDFCRKEGLEVASNFESEFKENCDKGTIGLCMWLKNDEPNVVIWLNDRPSSIAAFSTLLHELYHATDYISKARNLSEEEEARAYVFEYLSNYCLRAFKGLT